MQDLLSSVDFHSNRYEQEPVPTSDLLRAAGLTKDARGQDFVRAVRTWLEAVAASWHSFLPSEAVRIMVPEVVGNLAQANFEVWPGVLDQADPGR